MKSFKLRKISNKKGVAGLEVLLSVITMLFVIGLLVMIFSYMSTELMDQVTDTTSIKVMNDTAVAIAGSTEWFGIIIVITAMVVLILLTTLIIRAIKGSGLGGGM